MARISGVDIPAKKRVEVALTYIYGIGPSRSKEILKKTGISSTARTYELSDDEVAAIRRIIEGDYAVESDLRRDIRMNIKRLMDLGSYRGLRHRKSLPVNGQRTKTNSRTRKGPRKTVAGKKKAPSGK